MINIYDYDYKNDLIPLINILPLKVSKNINVDKLKDALEIVMDLGRISEMRKTNGEIEYISIEPITKEDINHTVSKIALFTQDNRAGIEGTLHRISAIRNRANEIIGLTLRIGRYINGTVECIKDIIYEGKSILFLGKPGIGKTTKLREIARILSDDMKKRVVIVDTSNEIAGDGDMPHKAIGKSRRMMVRKRKLQKDVMIEAVQNHTPEVIVVDEVGTDEEALACRTIAERGVMLVATAHGNTLENIIKNPTLSDLVGGIESVTLGDDEAKKRSTQKTVLERSKLPTFDTVIEIVDKNTLAIYKNTAQAVDYILRDWPIRPIIRKIDDNIPNLIESKEETEYKNSLNKSFSRENYVNCQKKYKKIYIYAVSKNVVDKTIERLNLNCEVTKTIDQADILLIHKSYINGGAKILSKAEDLRIQVFYVKSNSQAQLQKVLKEALGIDFVTKFENSYNDVCESALNEAKIAIDKLMSSSDLTQIELKPQNKELRRLQHNLVSQYNLKSKSVFIDDSKAVKIYK